MFFKRKAIDDLLLEKITIKNLNKYMPLRFSDLAPDYLYEGYGDTITNEDEIIFELNNADLNYIGNLNDIIPGDFIELSKKHNIRNNYLSILRLLLIVTDIDSYLDYYAKYYVNDWDITNLEGLNEFLVDYGIPYSYIQNFLDKQGLA